ncbi:MAG TPA: secretin N-terminal domain-containing protein [Gemmatimonadales bacterium]|nr:secretin N-terminal domain-containing protein [Gemmatimonadales bacterium]
MRRALLALAIGLAMHVPPLHAQDTSGVLEHGDSVTIRFVEADLRAVVQAMSQYLNKPLLTANLPGDRVTLETPTPVARENILPLLEGLAEAHGLRLTEDAAYFRLGPAPPVAPQPVTPSAAVAAQGSTQLFVIHLKHANAADVAATVNMLYGGTGAFAGAGLSTGTLSDELRRTSAATMASGNTTANDPQSASPAGGAVIVPDARTNSLLIRTTDANFALLQEAVAQLDTRPLQVLIEVLIVEARRDKSFSLGADLDLATQDLGDGATVEGSVRGAGVGDVVLKFMDLAKGRIDALLSVAESRGDVKIISRPVLLASNNTEARFLVGTQRPFVQVSRSLPTDTPSRDQVVQYKDVGTKLTVRPTINEDGYVSLVIQQEINAATSETQFDAPIISTREAATQVLVRDGQTIVLGGLRDQQWDRSHSGIPILSGIPIIGGIFGSTSRRSSETELYLFLTPRILRTDEDADAVTQPRLPPAERTDSLLPHEAAAP